MRALALLAAVLVVPSWAAAGDVDYSGEGVFDDLTGWNSQPKMARSADGTLYGAHAEADGAGGTRVVVWRDAPDGRGTRLAPPHAHGNATSRPSLALDAAGVLHVAWVERAGDHREVFAARWAEGAWGDVTQLSGGLGYAGFPSLAADRAGTVHVAWYGFDGAHYQTHHRAWLAGAWSEVERLSSGTVDSNNPSAAIDAEGGVHVAWFKDDGRSYHVWHAHQRPGEAWRVVGRVSEGRADALHAALAVDAGGTVHAVWDELREGRFAVLHATYDPAGSWRAPRVLAEGDEAGDQPAVAAWEESVLVAWRDVGGTLRATDLVSGPRPLLGGVEARLPSLRGAAWGPPSRGDVALDVLYTRDEGADARAVHVALRAGCDPFAPPDVCAPPPGGADARVPVPVALVLVALALAASTRRRDAFLAWSSNASA